MSSCLISALYINIKSKNNFYNFNYIILLKSYIKFSKMKFHLVSTVFFVLLLSVSGFAQAIEQQQNLNTGDSELRFLPSSQISPISSLSFQVATKYENKKNNFLLGTGYILQGLKFRNAVDQFNATAPFDTRGFEPTSFSSYSDLIETNYLLLNPTKPVK